ncbi:MAG: divalent-cation tolerance protein CutA [Gammaproteobacteria bacterium]|nr:divalent-cation tolerance protein CutA [Gammaproteobacteria bacterium]
MKNEVLVALVACPPDKAEHIAAVLVEGRYAACVNVVPRVVSTYRWKGKVERDDEALLIAKTTADRFEALKQAVLKLHPYELPEVVAVKLAAGHTPYLDWVIESTAA